jgi:hypothetical protein
MSMTLILWKAPLVDDPDEAKALLTPWYVNEDDSAFEPSSELGVMLDRLLQRYPYDPESDSPPWAEEPANTGRLLDLSIRWGGDGEVLDAIIEIAKEQDLVIYDPQGPDVYRAQDAPKPQPDERATAKDVLAMLLGLFLPFVGTTLAVWWFIPWGWLRWPLVAVGLFLSITAGIIVYAMVASLLGRLDEKPSAS